MSSTVNHTDKKVQSFLRKVMTGLEEDNSCWGWHHSGSFFFIVDEKPFASVLFRLFRNRRVQAFVQQLLHLGFSKLNITSVETPHGASLAVTHAFSHPLFLRGRPELLPQIGKLGAPLVTPPTPPTHTMFNNNLPTSTIDSFNPAINMNSSSTTPIIQHPLYPAQPNTTHTTTTTTTTITHSTSMYVESNHFEAHNHFHTNKISEPSPIEEYPSDDGNAGLKHPHLDSYDDSFSCTSPLLHHHYLHLHHQDGTNSFILDPPLLSSSFFPSQKVAAIVAPRANAIIPSPPRDMVSTVQSFRDLDHINSHEDVVAMHEEEISSLLPSLKMGQDELGVGSLLVHNPHVSFLSPSLFPLSCDNVSTECIKNMPVDTYNHENNEKYVAQLEILLGQIDRASSSLSSMINVSLTNLSIWSSKGLLDDQQLKCPPSLSCSTPFSSLPTTYPMLPLLPLSSLIDNTNNDHGGSPTNADSTTPILSSTPLFLAQPQTTFLVHNDLTSPPIVPLMPFVSSWSTPQSSTTTTTHTPLDFGMIDPSPNHHVPSSTSSSSSPSLSSSSDMTPKSYPNSTNHIHQPHPGGKRKCPFPIDPALPTDHDNDITNELIYTMLLSRDDSNKNSHTPQRVNFPLDDFGTSHEPSFNPALVIVDPATNTTLGQNLPRSTTTEPFFSQSKPLPHQQQPNNHSSQTKLAQRVNDVKSRVDELLKMHADSMTLQLRTYHLLQQGFERLATSNTIDGTGDFPPHPHNSNPSTQQHPHLHSTQIPPQHSSSNTNPSLITQPNLPAATQRATKRTKTNSYYDELSLMEPHQQQRVLSQYLGWNPLPSSSSSLMNKAPLTVASVLAGNHISNPPTYLPPNHPTTTLPITSLTTSQPTRSIFSPTDGPLSHSNFLSDPTAISSTINTTHRIHQDLAEIEGVVQYVLTLPLEDNENSEDNNGNTFDVPLPLNSDNHFFTHLSTLDHCPTITGISLSPRCSKQLNILASCHINNNGHTLTSSLTQPCSNLAISTSTTVREVHVATMIPSQFDCVEAAKGGSIMLDQPAMTRELTLYLGEV